MKQTLSISLMLTIVCISCVAQAQWFTTGNIGVLPTDYLGSQNAANLNFQTNSLPRMTILSSPFANFGYVGIGDYTTFTPQNFLHIHHSGFGSAFMQFSNATTGSGPTNGMRIGFNSGFNSAEIRNYQGGPVIFFNSTPFLVQGERLRLENDLLGTSYVTRVGISQSGLPFPNKPASLLHLGYNWAAGTGGHRLWMDIGTFSMGATDMCYFGLKNENTPIDNYSIDRVEAVINWGDNDNTNPDVGNVIRFIYTGVPGLGEASNFNGLETGRITWDGRWGIGNFSDVTAGNGSGLPPARKLEIYDAHQNDSRPAAPQFRLTYTPDINVGLGINSDFQTTSLGNLIITPENEATVKYTGIGNFNILSVEPVRRLELLDQSESAPQLRLTFTPNATITNGIWTDFQTTANGDLFIHPSNDGGIGAPVNQNVGINTSAPGNTLEINSTIGVSPRPAGLRFSNLNSGSPIDIPSNGRVLTVDNNGNVCLTDDGGGATGVCGTLTGADLNFLPKWNSIGPNQLCRSTFFEDNFGRASVNVVNTGGLSYNFTHMGTAMFDGNDAGAIAPYPYPTYNSTMHYPLSVKSFRDEDQFEGLAIYAEGNAIAAQDNLNIFANTGGEVNYVTINTNSYFRDRIVGQDYLGFCPAIRTTIVADDFSVNPAPFIAKLTGVNNKARFYSEASNKTQSIEDYAVWGDNVNGDANGHMITGIFGTAVTPCTGGCIGITNKRGGLFWAANSTDRRSECYAVQGFAWQADGRDVYLAGGVFDAGDRFNVDPNKRIVSSRENYGVVGRAQCPTVGVNYGGYFSAFNGNTSYAVYAHTPRVIGACPGPAICTQAAGYFNGDVFTTAPAYVVSDSTLKNNITPLQNSSSLFNSVNSYSYTFDTSTALVLPTGLHYGFLAQQVEQVFPSFVKEFVQPAEYDTAGNVVKQELRFKAIAYNEFIPILWHGYQQQQQKLDSITNVINNIQQTLNACCNSGGGTRNANPATIELENLATLQLLQNDPNPWSESTMVRWNIGKEFKQATIYFYDNNGAQINQYKIETQGKGELQVFGSKLSNGVYTYTLVVDGKIIDSKKMMKAQ